MARSKGYKKAQFSQPLVVPTSTILQRPSLLPGPPRFGQQNKLLHRFYEPVFLFDALSLGRTRGRRTTTPDDDGPTRLKQRQFLNDLAFICDFKKGGVTTTAIAVEDRPEDAVFWFAVNDTGAVVEKIETFLHAALQIISASLETDQSTTAVDKLTNHCLEASKCRIRDTIKILSRRITDCMIELKDSTDQEDRDLSRWMANFQRIEEATHLDICFYAYSHRRDPQMAAIKQRGENDSQNADLGPNQLSPFSAVQHFIGRLADHIRRPMRLITEAEHFQTILGNHFKVCPVPYIRGVSVPPIDGHTKLDRILIRMLPNDDPRRPMLDSALQELNRGHNILDLIKTQYTKITPCVHAEIQVLEHFCAKEPRVFALDDYRFIGCSKPACYCCWRYIKHHPHKLVVPDSHENLWPNWSPPLLGEEDENFKIKRNILGKIIQDVRDDAIQQISLRKKRAAPCHLDSVTGISNSVAGAAVGITSELDFVQQLTSSFSSLSLGAGESRLTPDASEHDNPYLSMAPFSPTASERLTSSNSSTSPERSDAHSPSIIALSHSYSPDLRTDEMDLDSSSDDEDGGALL